MAALRRPKRRKAQEEVEVPDDKVVEDAEPSSDDSQVENNDELAIERLRDLVSAERQTRSEMDGEACLLVQKYLNENHSEDMLAWVLSFTEVGKKAANRNMWSRGSWVPKAAQLEEITSEGLKLSVEVQERGKPSTSQISTWLALPVGCDSIDELRAALIRFTQRSGAPPSGAGSLLRLPGSTDDWSLPVDMWLNSLPNKRSVRSMFYRDVSAALRSAVADPLTSRRMKVVVTPPELNMEMDSYRVGTLLELVREVALDFVTAGMKVRICVQGSMGEGALTGVPRVLSGVRAVLSMMDWGAAEGGGSVVGNLQSREEGEALREGSVRFGAIGGSEVKADDDVFLVLAPQNMVGGCLMPALSEMADAAGGRALVLFNPLLQDRPSSAGLMGVRGRAERLAFAESFAEVYHFRLLYSGTTFMYPILGALRMSHVGRTVAKAAEEEDSPLYVLFRRHQSKDKKSEEYDAVAAFEAQPEPKILTTLVPSVPGDDLPSRRRSS